MKLAIIESPYAGDVERNVRYARLLCLHALSLGYAPYASHLFFTQPGLLDDDDPDERKLGIEAGLAWGAKADLTLVGTDLGLSTGMKYGIARANRAGRLIDYCKLELDNYDLWARFLDGE